MWDVHGVRFVVGARGHRQDAALGRRHLVRGLLLFNRGLRPLRVLLRLGLRHLHRRLRHLHRLHLGPRHLHLGRHGFGAGKEPRSSRTEQEALAGNNTDSTERY